MMSQSGVRHDRGIEVNASATLVSNNYKRLQVLKKARKDKFAHGVVPYDGTECYSFGDGMSVFPLSAL